eukprot:GHVQ01041191.1.p1 GENE.GHVQ01041191.1~~GHVQ01041191.1.p1  ORF type:complete len:176 (+),score=19.89 GHVQ01041191.1:386-913(+)
MNEFTTSRSSTYISSSNVPMKDRPPPLTSIETLELLQAGVHGTQGAVACGRAMATSPFHSLREPDVSLQDYFKTRIINYTDMETNDIVHMIVIIKRMLLTSTLRALIHSTECLQFSKLTCHRLCLTAALITCKFQHDLQRPSRHWASVCGFIHAHCVTTTHVMTGHVSSMDWLFV